MGAWARVEGTPIPMGSHSTSIVKHGIKVQSITILGKECAVGDEVRVQNCVCLPFKELKRVCLRPSSYCIDSVANFIRMLPTRLLCRVLCSVVLRCLPNFLPTPLFADDFRSIQDDIQRSLCRFIQNVKR